MPRAEGLCHLPVRSKTRRGELGAVATCVEPNRETKLPNAARSWSQTWHNHAYILPSIFLSLIVCAWFVTWGDWKFFEPEDFCGFYDAQARSLIEGRLDVPLSAIGNEAFTFQGKTYGYFGIGPALLRIPLVMASPKMDGLWSRMMMLIACAINLICIYCIMRLIRDDEAVSRQRLLHSLFILCAGIGSTNVFMLGRSFTYHEAIMWAGTFALLFTWALIKYLERPRYGSLALASFFAFMSFHCRQTVGSGVLMVMCVLGGILIWRTIAKSEAGHALFAFPPIAKPLRHALIAIFAVLLTIGTSFGLNYAKFRTFNAIPVQYYNCYHEIPNRMQVTGGRQIHPENIPTAVASYFGPNGITFDRNFPWVRMPRETSRVGSPAIDVVESFSSVPVSMPALLLLAVAGCAPLFSGWREMIRRARLPALALLCGGGIVLATVGITERYLHDFYPALILFAAIGVSRIEVEKRRWGRTAVITALTIISIYINCSFSFVHQRTTSGAPLAKRVEFRHIQHTFFKLTRGRWTTNGS
jgi:hypothetical protein